MSNRNRSIPPLTDEEEAEIQRHIAADPDNPEVTDEQAAQARPFAEVFPDLAASIKRERRLKATDSLRAHPPLFVTDDQLREIVAPHIGRDTFLSAVRSLERQGFPPKASTFRGRYLPAVRAWFDGENGLCPKSYFGEDGKENWDPLPRRGRKHPGETK
jgi:hypothetical protein